MTVPNFNEIQSTPPKWNGDFFNQDSIMPFGIILEAAQFNAVDAVRVTVTAAAAQNAVQLAVSALSGPLPAGPVLDFGGAKFARLTAAAVKNGVQLAVAPLPSAIAQNDTATYGGRGKKQIPSGTLVGRTIAERDAGTGWGPADVAGDDEIYLTIRDNSDLTKDSTNEVYRHNKVVKENYLPGFAAYTGAQKAKVRDLYSCIGGKN